MLKSFTYPNTHGDNRDEIECHCHIVPPLQTTLDGKVHLGIISFSVLNVVLLLSSLNHAETSLVVTNSQYVADAFVCCILHAYVCC